jgi:hypothetical protein
MLTRLLIRTAFGYNNTHWLFNIFVLITLPITVPFIAIPIDVVIGIISLIIGIIIFIFRTILYIFKSIYRLVRLFI